MTITTSLIIVAIAALIHASFQLSISMLTLLSSHTIGKKRSHGRLLLLGNAFLLGVSVMTLLLLTAVATLLQPVANSPLTWTICCGILAGVGVSVWLFYYRKQAGTTLWIPRSFARYLSVRAKKTKQSGEAFTLGLGSVFGELLFIFAPISVTALILLQLEPCWQLVGIAMYTLISLGSLLFVYGLIGGGLSISRIQKWREGNKQFLQFAAGTGLVVLGFYHLRRTRSLLPRLWPQLGIYNNGNFCDKTKRGSN